jgi:hypothetical protein
LFIEDSTIEAGTANYEVGARNYFGNIDLQASLLEINNGGSVRSLGGTIILQADELKLHNATVYNPNIFEISKIGDHAEITYYLPGTVRIQADRAFISNSFVASTGGSVTIDANELKREHQKPWEAAQAAAARGRG